MTASELVKQLPRVLQLRFERLGGYAVSILEESDPKYRSRYTRDELALIQLLALVYALDAFFRGGSDAARRAVALFRELGASGYQVGREMFTADSEATHRGQLLAEKLRKVLVDTSYEPLMNRARPLRSLVPALAQEVRRGRATLD